MGVIQRFRDIMAANINAVLDKAEDPEKMIDQYLRDLEKEIGNVKSETASVMAEEQRAKREMDAASEEANKYQKYAEKAVMAGNDADARQFLQLKKTAAEKLAALQAAYETAVANSQKMRQMYEKLTKDIDTLNERKAAIKAKMAMAKAQEKINKIGGSISGAADRLSAFDRMEEKANQMMDKANAMAELNKSFEETSAEDLMAKYDTVSTSDSELDDELAALKAMMNK